MRKKNILSTLSQIDAQKNTRDSVRLPMAITVMSEKSMCHVCGWDLPRSVKVDDEEILYHVGQAEVVNVAGVCSRSTNHVRHHEYPAPKTCHISPWVKPHQGQPDEEKLAAWPQRLCTTEHVGTQKTVGARSSQSSSAKTYGHSKWDSAQRLKTSSEEQTNSQEAVPLTLECTGLPFTANILRKRYGLPVVKFASL